MQLVVSIAKELVTRNKTYYVFYKSDSLLADNYHIVWKTIDIIQCLKQIIEVIMRLLIK